MKECLCKKQSQNGSFLRRLTEVMTKNRCHVTASTFFFFFFEHVVPSWGQKQQEKKTHWKMLKCELNNTGLASQSPDFCRGWGRGGIGLTVATVTALLILHVLYWSANSIIRHLKGLRLQRQNRVGAAMQQIDRKGPNWKRMQWDEKWLTNYLIICCGQVSEHQNVKRYFASDLPI